MVVSLVLSLQHGGQVGSTRVSGSAPQPKRINGQKSDETEELLQGVASRVNKSCYATQLRKRQVPTPMPDPSIH